MPGIERYPAQNTLAQFLDSADPIYGTGMDGNATLNGSSAVLGMTPSGNVYQMTRDIHFQNLSISSGVRLAPNGYRIFVKGSLNFGTGSSIGYVTGYSTAGSIQQGGAASTSVTHSLGGSAVGFTATPPTAALGGTEYFRVPHQAINGYSVTAAGGGPVYLRGGAGGNSQPGGGVVIVAARYMGAPSSGTASFRAPGTAPAGGGVILIVSSSAVLPSGITTDVSGQNSGTVVYMQVI